MSRQVGLTIAQVTTLFSFLSWERRAAGRAYAQGFVSRLQRLDLRFPSAIQRYQRYPTVSNGIQRHPTISNDIQRHPTASNGVQGIQRYPTVSDGSNGVQRYPQVSEKVLMRRARRARRGG